MLLSFFVLHENWSSFKRKAKWYEKSTKRKVNNKRSLRLGVLNWNYYNLQSGNFWIVTLWIRNRVDAKKKDGSSYFQRHDATNRFFIFFYYFFYFAHTNNYSTLHLQFITGNVIVYKKEIKRKRKTKSTKKISIVYILIIKRRLPALWSSITHLPVSH